MELAELKEKVMLLKSVTESLQNEEDAQPCLKANVRTIAAHVRLLCLELGLDMDGNQ